MADGVILERVARAINDALVAGGCYSSLDNEGRRYCHGDAFCIYPDDLARAAIAALAEGKEQA